MSGLILPGGGPVPARSETPAYSDLSEEQKAALDGMAAKEDPEALKQTVEYAFTVVKNPDGSFGIANDPEVAASLAPQRTPDENDYLSAFSVLQATITGRLTAAIVQQGMMQQAAMLQRAASDQQLRQHLKI